MRIHKQAFWFIFVFGILVMSIAASTQATGQSVALDSTTSRALHTAVTGRGTAAGAVALAVVVRFARRHPIASAGLIAAGTSVIVSSNPSMREAVIATVRDIADAIREDVAREETPCPADSRRLYRIVGSIEHASIVGTRRYLILALPTTLDQKQFWFTLVDALWFRGAIAPANDGTVGVRFLVSSCARSSTVGRGFHFLDAGHSAVSFDRQELRLVNRDAAEFGGILTLQRFERVQ